MRSNALRTVSAYSWIVPAYLIILGVIGFPLVENVVRSLFVAQGTVATFVGLGQYVALFRDHDFYSSLKLTLYWTVGVTIFQFLFGLFTALIVNQRTRIVAILKPILILPWALPGIVAATTWVFLYAENGLLDQFLGLFVKSPPVWLASSKWAMPAVILAGIWKGFPFYMLMLLAGLQSIPEELLEAAELDGARGLRVLWSVILPQMRPVIRTSLMLGVIWTSNYFDGIYLMTSGGPAGSTQTLPIWIYNVAFAEYDLNRAAVISVVLLVLVLLLVGLYFIWAREEKSE